MDFREVELDELLIAGFIESSEDIPTVEEDVNYSSWGEEEEVCPYCGESHSLKLHNEINWEDKYLPHRLLKSTIDKLLNSEDNFINPSKKYEIIRYPTGINSDKYSFNLVGLRVQDLNKVPFGFASMRFPKRRYLSITTKMENFNTLSDLDVIHNRDDLDDYFIIEYDLLSKERFNDLEITLYYPIREVSVK